MFKHFVTRLTMAALVAGLGLAASAATPPSKKPVAKAKPVAAAQADAASKALVERACQACHDLGTVTQARHTPAQWPGVVQRMRGNGADLTDVEAKQIQAYLAKTYGTKR